MASIAVHGMDGLAVDIECHISAGLPAMVIVGFANKAVEEARERLRGAFASSSLELPRRRIISNLAPGDVPKSGTGYDLAIAVAILSTSGQTALPGRRQVFIGELGLDGSVRPVRGIIGKLLAARHHGFVDCFVSVGNLEQARLVPGIQLYPLSNLAAAYRHLSGRQPVLPVAISDIVLIEQGAMIMPLILKEPLEQAAPMSLFG